MSNNNEIIKKHVFTWKIENLSMCCKKKGEKLISPTFRAKGFDETSWCLEFYPRGDSESQNGCTALYLRRKANDELSILIECNYDIEIINKNGQIVMCKKGKGKFEKDDILGFVNYMKAIELVKTALHTDILIIRCTLCGNMGENNFCSQNSATTNVKTNKLSFLLDVKTANLSNSQDVMTFFCSGSSNIKVTIQSPEDDVKIYIEREKNFSGSLLISCNFILFDVEGKVRDSKLASHLFENARISWEFPTFIKKSQLKGERDVFGKDGSFTLHCHIATSEGNVVESIVEYIKENENPPSADEFTFPDIDSLAVLNEDIKRMYMDKIHSDIKLKVGKEVFLAHKNILCARSPVFLAMFGNDMAESQKGEVDIPDFEANIVSLFLEYLYTGNVNDLDCENALKLIVAAEKYEVLSLKNKCAELLAFILSDANVCKVLDTADLVRHDTLKAFAVDYIRNQPDKILNSEEWKVVVKNNLKLATETVCEVSRFWGNVAKELSCKQT